MVSYYHQVYSHTVFSHSNTLSHSCHPCEHFHGVVLPPSLLTLTHSLTLTSMSSHSHFHGVVLPPSLLTHCSERTCPPTHTPIYHVLTHSAPLTSFHLILTTNSSQLISHTLPPIMPPSHHHHFLSPITTNHHQSLPLTPHNTPNPSISLPTLPIVS